jgi:ElaB/YqjD/DUF883 family membrane-anchored ribosome-binding protein
MNTLVARERREPEALTITTYLTQMKNDTVTAHTPRELRNELKALATEVGNISTDSGSINTLSENLHARFNSAQESVSDAYAGAKDKVTAGARFTDESIRGNPYWTMAIAIGLGLLVGVLAGRSSK